MQTRIEPKSIRYSFGSLSELGEYVANTREKWSSATRQSHKPVQRAWDLGASYDDAVRMACNGWIEGAERAQEALKAFAPQTPQPDTKVDFYGFRPHVPRFCAGAPDNMIRHTPTPYIGCGRVLTLAVQIGMAAYTSDKAAANFGVAVAQYVNQLEMDGMRVELIACYSCEWDNGRRVAFSWTVKAADQPLDLAVIAFAIGHPAMFRRLVFALMERSDAREWPGYGYPKDAEASDFINAPNGMAILNGMTQANTYAPTPAKALEYVSKQIDKAMEAQYA